MSEVSQPNEQLIEDAVAALVAFEGSESAEEILITVRVIHVHSVLWLRALLEENKRLREQFGVSPLEPLIKLQAELQQVKAELSAKDSALGDIADYQHRWSDSPITEVQKIARSILSQYGESHD